MGFFFEGESCRGLQFSNEGAFLFCGGGDNSLRAIDLNAGKLVFTENAAHGAPISAMKILDHADSMLLTGDDEGIIKLWDLRKKNAAFQWKDNEDYISDFAINGDKNLAVATSGDGFLSILHLRKGVLEARSDNLEDELLSVVLMKEGKKAVVGTQAGILNIWNWGNWGDISDRFPGHPNSIETMVKIDENTICTGSSDGLIRCVGILPNKLLGIVGEHRNFPIERIRLSRDKKYLGSCSHDNTVKFWQMEGLLDDTNDVETEPQNGKEESQDDMEEVVEQKQTKKKSKKNEFFKDI